MINLKRINGMKREYSIIRKIYIASFPSDERAPFFMLKRKAKEIFVDFISIYEDNDWVGFFYVVKNNELAYLFYFAIDQNSRGKGYGTEALRALIKYYEGYRIFLAIEEIDEKYQNYVERLNRKRFYENIGFRDLHTKVREGSVRYDLYGVGGTVMPEEYQNLMYMWAGPFIRKIFKLEV